MIRLMFAFLVGLSLAAAPIEERRSFDILADGKTIGDYQLTLRRQSDQAISVLGEANVRRGGYLFGYRVTVVVRELWHQEQLRRLTVEVDQRGRRSTISAERCVGGLVVVRDDEPARTTWPDVWTTSCWQQPEHEGPITLFDSESGRDVPAKLKRVGSEPLTIAGREQMCDRWRLRTAAIVDLWYDAEGRLVRRETREEGRHIIFELRTVERP